MSRVIKLLLFFLTPHLFFDKLQLLLAKRDLSFEEKIKLGKNVYIFLACDYANLGDYAITIAQKRILEEKFPDRNVVPIYISQTYSALKSILKLNRTDDIVTIIGGGNIGEMYYGYERKRNLVVEKLRQNRIISFPQTISFGKSALGNLALKRSIRTYSRHPDLTFFARERKSFDLMKKLFPANTVVLSPDVVMTLNYSSAEKRSGLTISLRNDKEGVLNDADKELIVSCAKTLGNVSFLDTCPHSSESLDVEFENLLNAYSKSRLVITDRLHGMVFAYITGTPAVVFDNSNGKILYSYEWIKDCGYIKLLKKDDIPCLSEIISHLNLDCSYKCENEKIREYFGMLGQ